jgi:hypothetical protein
MTLICNGPIGHRSISSVILTKEDTDISFYPRFAVRIRQLAAEPSAQAGRQRSVLFK